MKPISNAREIPTNNPITKPIGILRFSDLLLGPPGVFARSMIWTLSIFMTSNSWALKISAVC